VDGGAETEAGAGMESEDASVGEDGVTLDLAGVTGLTKEVGLDWGSDCSETEEGLSVQGLACEHRHRQNKERGQPWTRYQKRTCSGWESVCL
jgi:hypothetical protein